MPSTACMIPAKASSLNEWLETLVALTCSASFRKRSGSRPWSRVTKVLVRYSRAGVRVVLLRKPTRPKLTLSSSPRREICPCSSCTTWRT
ncbi:hypothetical protein D3C76_923850 [compost metagenome]